MGCVSKIINDKFPKQGKYLHVRARVHFHYDTSKSYYGTIIRDDAESPDPESNSPGMTLIHLDDGRVVSATECQYSPEIGAYRVRS
jgi:hypothetical protein